MKFDLCSQDGKKPFVLPWFLDEVPRTPSHGLDGQFHISPCGHHDDWQRAIHRNNFRKQIQAFFPRCSVPRVVEINQHGIVGSRERLAGKPRRAIAINLVALRLQQKLDRLENVLLVVGRQNAGYLQMPSANAAETLIQLPVWLSSA